ncbi:MAG: small acid-soluble spore protein SspI [Bacilli bacterium]|nr:small acid-soluble spore protein SspI [Bacilli bacterium]
MSIREHIINNFSGDDHDSLQNAINESIESNDEVTLPGMGVFFEIVWQGADQELKNKILEIIRQRVNQGQKES